MSEQIKILVVEDDLVTRTVMTRTLNVLGYKDITAVDTAEAAIELLQEQEFEVMLLDWGLPGMDGVELCKYLRSDNRYDYLYIIFLTARDATEHMVVALEAGADDFSSKPFGLDEMRARLNVATRMVTLERKLKEQNIMSQRYAQEMEELAEERAKQLTHAGRMVTLGGLSAGVAHEINNPITFIAGNINVLQSFIPFINDLIDSTDDDAEHADELSFIKEELPKLVGSMENGVERTTKIIDSLKAFAHCKNDIKYEPINISEVITESLTLCSSTQCKRVIIDVECEPDLPHIQGDLQQLEQVLVNLIVNASDAMEDVAKPRINISVVEYHGNIVMTVRDNGPGIPEELLEKVWDPFFTTKPIGKGTGLGLSISYGIIEEHNGTIEVYNNDIGAEFVIKLPIDNTKANS